MTAKLYVHNILHPLVFLLMQQLQKPFLNKTLLGSHSKGVSRLSPPLVTTLPWPARSPDLSPIKHIWDHLE
ncbi:hypothetical protein TNCV_1028681 [Trichonephila clavipes]|nr:hypothetical protein TNCV_1028681 [Trichonephila clavipes]